MNLEPLGDRLIVEVLEEEATTASGIVLPDTAQEKPQRGKVLAVGPGPRDEDGDDHPLPILRRLVAKPDRRGLAAGAELVGDDGRVEVEREGRHARRA